MNIEIIIIGVCIIYLAWSYLKIRALRYNKLKLQVGKDIESAVAATFPTWITDPDAMERFISMLIVVATIKRKIPEHFVVETLGNEFVRNKLFGIAGLMENRGASFEEQTMSACDLIQRYWVRSELKKSGNNG